MRLLFLQIRIQTAIISIIRNTKPAPSSIFLCIKKLITPFMLSTSFVFFLHGKRPVTFIGCHTDSILVTFNFADWLTSQVHQCLIFTVSLVADTIPWGLTASVGATIAANRITFTSRLIQFVARVAPAKFRGRTVTVLASSLTNRKTTDKRGSVKDYILISKWDLPIGRIMLNIIIAFVAATGIWTDALSVATNVIANYKTLN